MSTSTSKGTTTTDLVVYADFTCPECYLAVRRADVLAAAGVPVDVRAVEHLPELPAASRRLTDADRNELTERFDALGSLLLSGETLPWSMPPVRPRSQAAVSAYAETYASPVAVEVRRLLFELYWREGADIGNPTVLRTPLAGAVLRSGITADPLWQSGYAVAMTGGPVTTAAYRRIRSWRDEWRDLGGPPLPIVLSDGATLHGIDAVRRLGKQITYAGVDLAPEVDDPRRYPSVDNRPPRGWVSEIGNRWRTSYRLGD